MEAEKLVSMANQVASFFDSYPRADAAAGVADHLKAFWTPGMCRTLEQRLAAGAEGLHPAVVLALRAPPDVPIGASPIVKEIAGPAELGQLASDAG